MKLTMIKTVRKVPLYVKRDDDTTTLLMRDVSDINMVSTCCCFLFIKRKQTEPSRSPSCASREEYKGEGHHCEEVFFQCLSKDKGLV